MTINAVTEEKIIVALLKLRENYDGTDGQFAKMWGINPSIWSRIKGGERKGLIAHDKLVTMGRKLNVQMMDAIEWTVVQTETFQFITEQMAICQREGISRMLVEMADIGKTTTAKHYMMNNRNVFYVDCSQNKSLKLFIKALAKCMGVSVTGTLADIVADIKYCINATYKPLIILDEFGDLEYRAFLEVKNLWNGTENACGWYAMGADGLKTVMERGINGKRVGFVEIFRRFGTDYMTVRPPMTPAQVSEFKRSHIEAIAHANLPNVPVGKLIAKSDATDVKGKVVEILSLTRIKERIIKMKRDAA